MVNASNDNILIGRDQCVLDLVMHPESSPRTLQLDHAAPEGEPIACPVRLDSRSLEFLRSTWCQSIGPEVCESYRT